MYTHALSVKLINHIRKKPTFSMVELNKGTKEHYNTLRVSPRGEGEYTKGKRSCKQNRTFHKGRPFDGEIVQLSVMHREQVHTRKGQARLHNRSHCVHKVHMCVFVVLGTW